MTSPRRLRNKIKSIRPVGITLKYLATSMERVGRNNSFSGK
jgi:hypothetical protein